MYALGLGLKRDNTWYKTVPETEKGVGEIFRSLAKSFQSRYVCIMRCPCQRPNLQEEEDRIRSDAIKYQRKGFTAIQLCKRYS